MPFSKEFEFPSDEELTIREINLSLSRLRAGALHLGKFCEQENNEFILCRNELRDPRKCLKEGRDVTNCAFKFFCKVKNNCCKEFETFAKCLAGAGRDMDFKYCRNYQAIFDKCMLDKLGIEKPPFGWQAKVHIHHTDRPEPETKITYFPGTPDKLPDDIKKEEPKFGLRRTFF